MKKVLLAAALLGGMLTGCTNKEQTKAEENMTTLNLTQEWDKVFPLSEKVNHRKVTFEQISIRQRMPKVSWQLSPSVVLLEP